MTFDPIFSAPVIADRIDVEDPFSLTKSIYHRIDLQRKNVNRVDKPREKTLRMFCFKY